LPPYPETDAPHGIPKPIVPLDEIGVERWQYDFWYCIVRAALSGDPDRPDYLDLPNFDDPAISRYAATTPELLRWFDGYNEGKPYLDQVRPFNFLLAAQARLPGLPDGFGERQAMSPTGRSHAKAPEVLRPVAPYTTDRTKAIHSFFDRNTGCPVPADRLKTYREALAQYHLHPESKFNNGDYLEVGPTQRRHIQTTVIHNIGKEADRWEEQAYLGIEPEAQIEYGIDPGSRVDALDEVRKAVDRHGPTEIARISGVSRQQVSAIARGKSQPKPETLEALLVGVSKLDGPSENLFRTIDAIRECVMRHCAAKGISMRQFARDAGVDPGHLSKVMNGKRRPTNEMMKRLEPILAS
jgi:transcriptional regulator with XRE-family HTH domain